MVNSYDSAKKLLLLTETHNVSVQNGISNRKMGRGK